MLDGGHVTEDTDARELRRRRAAAQLLHRPAGLDAAGAVRWLVAVQAQDGAVPDEGFLAACEVESEGALAPWPRLVGVPEAERWLVRYAPGVTLRALEGVREATARRHAREAYEQYARRYVRDLQNSAIIEFR